MSNSISSTQRSPEDNSLVYVNSSEQRTEVTTGGVAQPRKRVKTQPFDSVEQLLRAIYEGTFKRLTLKKEELTAMRKSPELKMSEMEEFLVLTSSTDITLDKTRQSMLLCAGLDAPIITSQIQKFVGEVLRRHPAFRANLLAEGLDNHLGGIAENQLVKKLVSQNYTSLSWPEGLEPMKKKEMEQCKANALYCLLLWFRMTRRTSVESIQYYLQVHLWKPTTRRYKTETEWLRVLISTRNPAAASITSELLERQVLKQIQRADTATMAEERAAARMEELVKELGDVRVRLTASQAEVDRLMKELAQENQERTNERAHLKNDYEQLRGQVLRRLKDELSLLDEGLHALRLETPKVHVMIDHAERAIDGLKREMERLRGE